MEKSSDNTKMKITPIGERVVLSHIKAEEKTKSGIYLPKGEEEKNQGIVEEIGSFSNGNPLPLKKGDRVLYSGYGHEDIEIDGKKFLIVEFKDIVGVLE